jgi:nitrogen fixation NifU-like protein
MYSAQVLDHFENPRNAGEIDNADARVRIENPACGDILELTAKIAAERMVEIRFRAKGCVSAMACSSALTEMVAGRTLAEARALTREELLEKVGGLPEASGHAAYLAMDALQALLKKV